MDVPGERCCVPTWEEYLHPFDSTELLRAAGNDRGAGERSTFVYDTSHVLPLPGVETTFAVGRYETRVTRNLELVTR